jgi:hypothetical protein
MLVRSIFPIIGLMVGARAESRNLLGGALHLGNCVL